MAPTRAAESFRTETPDAAAYRVTLHGSLAATGRGHLTDQAIARAFAPRPVEFVWRPDEELPEHPNALTCEALDAAGQLRARRRYFSLGGGAWTAEGAPPPTAAVYPRHSMRELLAWSEGFGRPLWQYASESEGPELEEFLGQVWAAMRRAVERGLAAEGVLAGGLHLPRKARSFARKAERAAGGFRRRGLLFAYALAAAEENAGGGEVVTAPTCGSSGILPAVLYHFCRESGATGEELIRSLATAGLIGNLIKHHASISGAEVGCQGEVGAACAMAAAAAAQLLGGTPAQIEYAAEMGLEHHLGLTCDPIAGQVQVPCIERNAFAAARALDCADYALLSDGRHLVSFDEVVEAMNRTGHDLPRLYRETAAGGLAVVHGQV